MRERRWRSIRSRHLQPPARRLELLRESQSTCLAGGFATPRGGMRGGSNAAQLGGDLHGDAATVTRAADLGPFMSPRACCCRPRRHPVSRLSAACGIAVTSERVFGCAAFLARVDHPVHAAWCSISGESNAAGTLCFCWRRGCKPPCMGLAAGSSCTSDEALIAAARTALPFAILRSTSMRLISPCTSGLCSSADAEGRWLGSRESSSVSMVFSSHE